MEFFREFPSPVGNLYGVSDGKNLTGLLFKKPSNERANAGTYCDLPVFGILESWLFDYFAGKAPDPLSLPLKPRGTDFCLAVWRVISSVPYAHTASYASIARALGKGGLGARAVGGAAGKNPLPILIPCHRIVASNGDITGFTGGLDIKKRLLALEGVVSYKPDFFPEKLTAFPPL